MKKRKSMCMIFIFLSLQLLEDTPAVLSLGKLCKEHGFTSGPAVASRVRPKTGSKPSAKPRTSSFGSCGLSSNSSTSSSSTSRPQDLSISLDPAKSRSNEEVAGNCNEEQIAGHSSEGFSHG